VFDDLDMTDVQRDAEKLARGMGGGGD